jgi:hypothetical protein
MTFAAAFFGMVGILAFGALAFMVAAAWREDRTRRPQRADAILSRPHDIIDDDIAASIRERCRYGRFPFLMG